ncbi:Monooxygenase PC-14 (Penitrem biosynthesis cluster 1 protein PC-14) [Durusdinium trenchii]|uniref:Monooxygenase PC-14 (Penitrem biosynthesis cluster 1 protein PC-14) n=1 Tax=Durusdinium trenchii TaxID=1381693 RepID=A0ABP0HTB4_9DINO
MRVLVVGAGPSGLVAAKTLGEAGWTARVVEASDRVGGTFANKTYDDGRLVSSKFITAFSDARLGGDVADHPSIEAYLAYLEEYCERFGLRDKIRFDTVVEEVGAREVDTGEYVVRLRLDDGRRVVERYDAVCVCSGLHNVPSMPEIPGLDKFEGETKHSSQYKDKSEFAGKRVLVVGSGETGLDLVFRAIQVTPDVVLATRSGFLSVPYVIADGLPLDTFITNLCECSHLHPLLERFKIKWKFTTPFIRLAFMLGTGSSVGYNQWAGGKRPEEVQRGHLIINKSTDAMPFINRAAKRKSWLGRKVFSFLDDGPIYREFADREITTKRGIKRFVPNSKLVEFDDGSQVAFDLVVFATGYQVSFPFISQDQHKQSLPNEHNIVRTGEPTLAFIGFVRPNVGAIPPMSEMQVMWWIQRLRGAIDGPTAPPTYRLLGKNERTGAYGVDYGAYMHDLARDIGAAPTLRGFASTRALVAWALGQAYVPFFRLQGPFADPDALRIAETELFDPVARRPWASNALFVFLIGLFSVFNVLATIASPVVALVDRFMTSL